MAMVVIFCKGIPPNHKHPKIEDSGLGTHSELPPDSCNEGALNVLPVLVVGSPNGVGCHWWLRDNSQHDGHDS